MSLDEDDLTINRIYLTWPPDKYDICISIVVLKGADTGKLYDIKPIFSIVIK